MTHTIREGCGNRVASRPVLSGLRVLDVTNESGFLAGKILGDLGADVVKVEPPGGDREGRRPPWLGGVADPERSLAWLALNTSKRGVTLDLRHPRGRDLFARLLDGADVLLDTFAPGELDELGLGWEAMRAAHPRLVRCAITPFGQSGPYAGYRASDLVVVAMGGCAATTGDPDRPPVRCTLPTSYYHAAPEAVFGVLCALHAREETGRGQLVDVSLHECQLGALLGAPALHGNAAHPPRRTGARTGLAASSDARAVLAHPQLRDRELFVTIAYPHLGAAIEHPAFFAKTRDGAVRVRRRAPRIGEHNEEVYGAAGFAPEEIAKLAAEGLL
jgi:crotonobetainyl-CoA:carnitine CoA-transferase CaiB-like acyl-CoA transferase